MQAAVDGIITLDEKLSEDTRTRTQALRLWAYFVAASTIHISIVQMNGKSHIHQAIQDMAIGKSWTMLKATLRDYLCGDELIEKWKTLWQTGLENKIERGVKE